MNSGRTFDNFEVTRDMGLRLGWSWPEITRMPMSDFWIGVRLEFNHNADGKKYPYLCVGLGNKLLQCGWLWG